MTIETYSNRDDAWTLTERDDGEAVTERAPITMAVLSVEIEECSPSTVRSVGGAR